MARLAGTSRAICHRCHENVNDLLIWEHIGTLHNAIPDYGPDEHRMMLRCQVMCTPEVFKPELVQRALQRGAVMH